jgi:GT2 family glycosyltransferase
LYAAGDKSPKNTWKFISKVNEENQKGALTILAPGKIKNCLRNYGCYRHLFFKNYTKMMMKSLTIYILCHNRPDYARQAIQSIMDQTCRTFKLIVSDNSSNDDVERMVKNEFPDTYYIRRLPMLKAAEHFNRCIEEANTDYFCLFHDDDVMSSNYVDAMMQCAHDYPSAIAIGCNANIERFGKLEPRASFCSFRKHEIIPSPQNLAMRYFSRAQSGIAPFPGYIYNRRLVGSLRLPLEGGKYADVTWLLSLAIKGSIVWINSSLMTYRMHESNDSNIESPRDRLRFLGFLKQNRKLFRAGLLEDYRCSFIYKKILRAPIDGHAASRRVAISFLNNYRWSRYMRLDTYKALAVRLLVKWVAE